MARKPPLDPLDATTTLPGSVFLRYLDIFELYKLDADSFGRALGLSGDPERPELVGAVGAAGPAMSFEDLESLFDRGLVIAEEDGLVRNRELVEGIDRLRETMAARYGEDRVTAVLGAPTARYFRIFK